MLKAIVAPLWSHTMLWYIVVACILVPLVQSFRLSPEKHRNLRTHTGSSRSLKRVKRGHDESAAKTDIDEPEGYLACVDVRTGQRMIIQAAEKMFWNYYLNEFDGGPAIIIGADSSTLTDAGNLSEGRIIQDPPAPRSLKWKCKAFSPPQSNKAAYLSILPSNVTEIIRSFEPRAVITCSHECRCVAFGMNHFGECSSATTPAEFNAVQESVFARGGDCGAYWESGMSLGKTSSLEDCMANTKHDAFPMLEGRRFFNRCMVMPADEALKIEVEFIKAEEENPADAQSHIADMRRNRELDDHVFAGLSPMS